MVIVGGGYIGLEVAATARELGLEVTVLEMADRVMNRVTCCEISSFYEAEHARHGVRIVCNARVQAFERDSTGRNGSGPWSARTGQSIRSRRRTRRRRRRAADELAQAAGLECMNGVVVDQHCRTADPPFMRRATAAATPTSTTAAACGSNPWTTPSSKRERRAEHAWHADATCEGAVVLVRSVRPEDDHRRPQPGIRRHGPARLPRIPKFSACYLFLGELLAVDTVNAPKDQMAARKLVAARARPDPAKLADASVPLKDCL